MGEGVDTMEVETEEEVKAEERVEGEAAKVGVVKADERVEEENWVEMVEEESKEGVTEEE